MGMGRHRAPRNPAPVVWMWTIGIVCLMAAAVIWAIHLA